MFNQAKIINLQEQVDELKEGLFTTDAWSFYQLWNGGEIKKTNKIHQLRDEFDELDKKFDALCEYLKVEFVDEDTTISDGSVMGDKEIQKFYCRKKINRK